MESSFVGKAFSGGIAGGLCGAALSAAVCLTEALFFEKERPIQYTKNGKACRLTSFELTRSIKPELAAMAKYRACCEEAFNEAMKHTERACLVFCTFESARALGQDGVRYITKFQTSAGKADQAWGTFYSRVTDQMGLMERTEVQEAMNSTHEAMKKTLGHMRDVFAAGSAAPPPGRAGR